MNRQTSAELCQICYNTAEIDERWRIGADQIFLFEEITHNIYGIWVYMHVQSIYKMTL